METAIAAASFRRSAVLRSILTAVASGGYCRPSACRLAAVRSEDLRTRGGFAGIIRMAQASLAALAGDWSRSRA